MGFFKSFELPDDAVSVFEVVFGDPGFDAGGIKEEHGSLPCVDLLADGFSQINQTIKHCLEIREEILLEAGELRCVGDNIKTTEIA